MKLIDKFNRVHDYLRISLTDKCNLNCLYCNPGINHKKPGTNKDILSYEEISRIIRIFVSDLEFTKIRLTGGEPFARKNINILFDEVNKIKNDFTFELSATTNGTLLNGNMGSLKSKGLNRLNFSLDSLNQNNYKRITGKDDLAKVMQAIEYAEQFGFNNIKINTVIIKGVNDSELIDFIDFIAVTNRNIRFIEYMPFSNNDYNSDYLVTASDMQKIISTKYTLIADNRTDGVAKTFSIKGYSGKVSFISSISDHFCDSCNRLRLTSYGELKLCLFAQNGNGLSIRNLIRNGATDEEIVTNIQSYISEKEYDHPPLEKLIQLKDNQMISIGG